MMRFGKEIYHMDCKIYIEKKSKKKIDNLGGW
jgi:hypothetical protein